MNLQTLGKLCKQASFQIMKADTHQKNTILQKIAEELFAHIPEILEANAKDLAIAKKNHMSEGLLDRMTLTKERLEQMLQGIYQVQALDDPIGEITHMKTMKNGLQIGQMRVALGVVGMIYEARPNVTVDAAILCLKAGNSVMLRGSKDILHSNIVLVNCMQRALKAVGFQEHTITLIEDTSRETATAFMKMNAYLDVLIPRGGKALIKTTIEQASVPVLETGTGNCHVYVDKDAELDQALPIIINAKTSRTSVCNACESVLFHRDIKPSFIKKVIAELKQHHVIIHADAAICELDTTCILATKADYATEFLGLEISMKYCDSLDEAIEHINEYGTHHSETIVSHYYENIKKFMREVDSACVYANASTRFSDGYEFGLGAEIGISTQKLHARGPMGLRALTSEKFIILGDGQIR